MKYLMLVVLLSGCSAKPKSVDRFERECFGTSCEYLVVTTQTGEKWLLHREEGAESTATLTGDRLRGLYEVRKLQRSNEH